MRRRRKRTRDEYHPIDNGDGTASVPLSTVHSETTVFSLITVASETKRPKNKEILILPELAYSEVSR